MDARKSRQLKDRVIRCAETVLDVKGYVSPIELLKQMQLLAGPHVRLWEKGVGNCLMPRVQGSPAKLNLTFKLFTEWARENALPSVPVTLRTSGRDQSRELQVTPDADLGIEAFFRTCYAPADITPRKLEALKKKLNKPPDLVVFMTVQESVTCKECGTEIRRGDFLFLDKEECRCLPCADLDYLEFLPSGNTALSRRARKHSPLSAVVVQFNRRAKRYERRGILVTSRAIEQAEVECLSDADQRAAQRERNAGRRRQEDDQLTQDMTALIREMYPGCPAEEARRIASHTAERGSGRVGRSAAGRRLREEAVHLAVVAYIRHEHTRYDEFLMTGIPRDEARRRIASRIDDVLAGWKAS